MVIAHSKVRAQGQVSMPAAVRRKLGIEPGSVLEWGEDGDKIVVRRVKYTLADIHRAAFPEGPPKRRTLSEMKEGIRQYVRQRYPRPKTPTCTSGS